MITSLKQQWNTAVHCEEGVAELLIDHIIDQVLERLLDDALNKVRPPVDKLVPKEPVAFANLWKHMNSDMIGVRCPQTVTKLGRPLSDSWTLLSPYPCNRDVVSKIELVKRKVEAARPRSRPQSSTQAARAETRSQSTQSSRPGSAALFKVTEDNLTTFPYSLAAHKGSLRAFGKEFVTPLKTCKIDCFDIIIRAVICGCVLGYSVFLFLL
eukprot:GEMP01063171.1.p1 GENE.GEMP01063171.1~~GEMP01063171.1.p1  ORF type:complete len:211 (+),score=36.72 GEMP01063171.1:447-1079(+)